MSEQFYKYLDQYTIIGIFLIIIWFLRDPVVRISTYFIDKIYLELATRKEIEAILLNNNDINNEKLIESIKKVLNKN